MQQNKLKAIFSSTIEKKDYNVMIDEQNLFDQPGKNNLRANDNIQKIATGQGDNYTHN